MSLRIVTERLAALSAIETGSTSIMKDNAPVTTLCSPGGIILYETQAVMSSTDVT